MSMTTTSYDATGAAAGTKSRATSWPWLTNLVDWTWTFVVSPASDQLAAAPDVNPLP